jgi:hypothetical protein
VSAVRMCDQPDCARIFSENEAGWATGTVSQMRRIDGRMVPVNVTQDRCPQCAGNMTPDQDMRPRVDNYPNENRNRAVTAHLEREAGISPGPE